MKKLFLLVTFILVSTYSFADIQTLNFTNTKNVRSLADTWRSSKSMKPQPIANDMTIVYGGADISHKQVLSTQHNFIV